MYYFPILVLIGLAILAWYLFNTNYSDVHEVFEHLAQRHNGKVQKIAPFTFPKLFLAQDDSTLIITVEKDKDSGRKRTIAQYLVARAIEDFRVISESRKKNEVEDSLINFEDRFEIDGERKDDSKFLNQLLSEKVREALEETPIDVQAELTMNNALVGYTNDGTEIRNPCIQFSYDSVLVDESDYEDFIRTAKIIAHQASSNA